MPSSILGSTSSGYHPLCTELGAEMAECEMLATLLVTELVFEHSSVQAFSSANVLIKAFAN